MTHAELATAVAQYAATLHHAGLTGEADRFRRQAANLCSDPRGVNLSALYEVLTLDYRESYRRDLEGAFRWDVPEEASAGSRVFAATDALAFSVLRTALTPEAYRAYRRVEGEIAEAIARGGSSSDPARMAALRAQRDRLLEPLYRSVAPDEPEAYRRDDPRPRRSTVGRVASALLVLFTWYVKALVVVGGLWAIVTIVYESVAGR